MSRIVSWFSCGAASAVATRLAIKKYGDRVVVAYCDTLAGEHDDNRRFLSDCEEWFGKEIVLLGQSKYENHRDVARQERFLRGPRGARCTVELKKKARLAFQQPDDIHVWGYTSEESARAARMKDTNPELESVFPLIENSLSKQDCIAILNREGIEMPRMYELGYNNNNCIGCFKAEGAGYWNKIREDFPEVFQETARIEKDLGYALVRVQADGKKQSVFLDDLDPTAGNHKSDPSIECSMLCEIAISEMNE